jgi:hypothetical protein
MKRVITAAVLLTLAAAAPAKAADLEGYHDPGKRIGCVMMRSASNAHSVRCGARGSSKGLILSANGSARKVSWHWPASSLGQLFFTVTYGTTYYLVGGTAKLDGTNKDLRCRWSKAPSVRVKCSNANHSITVTKTQLRST